MLSREKVAYLRGLADGLELGKETKQDKLITAIIDVLDVIAGDIDVLDESFAELVEEVDAISEDLSDVEEIIYDGVDCCCDDDDCCDDECCCHEDDYDDHECCCGGHHHEEEAHECCCGGHHHEEDAHEGCCGGHHSGALYSVTCPACGKELTVDERTVARGGFDCPYCNATLEFDLDDETEPAEDK